MVALPSSSTVEYPPVEPTLSSPPGSDTAESPIDRRALCCGHPDAWNQLVGRYMPTMLRQARAILHHQHEAQDATQAVFLRLWRRRRRLETIDALEPYLISATRNEARNILRQQKIDAQLQDAEAISPYKSSWNEEHPGRGLEAKENQALVERLSKKLTPAQRVVLGELRRNPDCSARQIGRQLGCSHRNVLDLLRRIRQTLVRQYPDQVEGILR